MRKDLFDHLVGGYKQSLRHGEAKRLRGLEVEDQFKCGRLQHRQLGGLSALKDAAGTDADLKFGPQAPVNLA
jgi:hypothetical protein